MRVVLYTDICHYREDCNSTEDFLPGTNTVGLGCHRSSELSGELPGVHSNFNDVVDKGQ